jgi:hypothetical protein
MKDMVPIMHKESSDPPIINHTLETWEQPRYIKEAINQLI